MYKFNFCAGVPSDTSKYLIEETKRLHAINGHGLPLAEYARKRALHLARGDAATICAYKRYLRKHAELVPGIGVCYARELFEHIDEAGELSFFVQLIHAGVGIKYECDGLYTIDWPTLREFAEG